MLKLYKRWSLVFSAGVLICSAIAFTSTSQFATLKLAFNYWDPLAISHYRLSMLSGDAYIQEIEQAIAENDIAEAQTLVSLAKDYGHQIPKELEAKTIESYLGTLYRYTTGFTDGFINGEISSLPTVLGSISSDLTGYGDVRDLSNEGLKYINNEDYDAITLGLSAAGVITTGYALASTVVSATGVGAPVGVPNAIASTNIDNGISVLKSVNKAKKLSQPLVNKISNISDKIVNKSALNKALNNTEPLYKLPSLKKLSNLASEIDYKKMIKGDFSDTNKVLAEASPVDINQITKQFSSVIDKKSLDELDDLARGTGELLASGGVLTSMRALSLADDAKDLSKLSSLSSRFGQKTSSVLKILGKNAIKLGKLLYWLITIFVSVAIWCLWVIWLSFKMTNAVRKMIFRKKTRVAHEVQ